MVDSFVTTRAVTNTQETFIRNPTGSEHFWVFRNLGPAKIVIMGFNASAASTLNELRPGDCVEINCQAADVKLAGSEPYNASIVQWMRVS